MTKRKMNDKVEFAMKKKRPAKGEYGSRNRRKYIQIAEVAFGAVAILIQLGARALVEGEAYKNVLTVMAIVSVLPTANVASPLLAAIRYWTPGEEFYRRLQPFEEKCTVLYDLIITSKEQILPMDGILVHPSGVYFFCSNPKADEKKAENYLNEVFRAHRLDPNAKVITDEKAFFRRAESLKPASAYEDDGSVEYAAELLKNLSM